jgi:hypothetical protein
VSVDCVIKHPARVFADMILLIVCSGVAPKAFLLDPRASFRSVSLLCFQVAQLDPAAFHVILGAAASDIARLHKRSNSVQSITHLGYALSFVKTRLAHPNDLPSDGTLAAVAMLAGNEVRRIPRLASGLWQHTNQRLSIKASLWNSTRLQYTHGGGIPDASTQRWTRGSAGHKPTITRHTVLVSTTYVSSFLWPIKSFETIKFLTCFNKVRFLWPM